MKRMMLLLLCACMLLPLMTACGDGSGGGGLGTVNVYGGGGVGGNSGNGGDGDNNGNGGSKNGSGDANSNDNNGGNNGSNGDGNANGGDVGANGRNGLVGKWVGRVYTFTQQDDEIDRWIEFKSDGTYNFYLNVGTLNSSGGMNVSAGLLTESGKYSVNEEEIVCTNRVQSFKSRINSNTDYTDMDLDSINWPFRLETYMNTNNDWYTGLTCLSINMYPNLDTGYDDYFQNIKYDIIESVLRWPAGLPDYLYPSGFTGCVFSSVGPVLDIEKAFRDKQRVSFQIRMHESYESELSQYEDILIANGFSLVGSEYRKEIDMYGTSYDFRITLGANNWVNNYKTAYIQFACFVK